MTYPQDNDNKPALLMPEDHAVLANSQAVAVLLAFQFTNIAVLRRCVAPHRLSNSLGRLTVNSTKIAERWGRPDDLHYSRRSSSDTQSPRR